MKMKESMAIIQFYLLLLSLLLPGALWGHLPCRPSLRICHTQQLFLIHLLPEEILKGKANVSSEVISSHMKFFLSLTSFLSTHSDLSKKKKKKKKKGKPMNQQRLKKDLYFYSFYKIRILLLLSMSTACWCLRMCKYFIVYNYWSTVGYGT